MKLLIVLFMLCLMLVVSCKSGPLADIRIGKSFAIVVPEEVFVHTSANLRSETFKLEEAEEFVVEDAVCAEGVGTLDCWSDLAISMDMPELAKVAFYKVRFESGKEGYINALYFYPELSLDLTSEERTAVRGTTPKAYAAEVRRKDKAFWKDVEDREAMRRAAIEAAPWSDKDKEIVLKRSARVGMTKDQIVLSQTDPQVHVPKITIMGTQNGLVEIWKYDDVTFYFLNGVVTSWEMTVKDVWKHQKESIPKER